MAKFLKRLRSQAKGKTTGRQESSASKIEEQKTAVPNATLSPKTDDFVLGQRRPMTDEERRHAEEHFKGVGLMPEMVCYEWSPTGKASSSYSEYENSSYYGPFKPGKYWGYQLRAEKDMSVKAPDGTYMTVPAGTPGAVLSKGAHVDPDCWADDKSVIRGSLVRGSSVFESSVPAGLTLNGSCVKNCVFEDVRKTDRVPDMFLLVGAKDRVILDSVCVDSDLTGVTGISGSNLSGVEAYGDGLLRNNNSRIEDSVLKDVRLFDSHLENAKCENSNVRHSNLNDTTCKNSDVRYAALSDTVCSDSTILGAKDVKRGRSNPKLASASKQPDLSGRCKIVVDGSEISSSELAGVADVSKSTFRSSIVNVGAWDKQGSYTTPYLSNAEVLSSVVDMKQSSLTDCRISDCHQIFNERNVRGMLFTQDGAEVKGLNGASLSSDLSDKSKSDHQDDGFGPC